MAFKIFKGLFGSKKPNMEITKEYQEWRELIFSVQPEQVEGSRSDAARVYGVIMDIGQIDRRTSTHWAISMSTFPTGETSLRPTSGGGVAGLGGDPKVAQAAKEIVQIAQGVLPEAHRTQDLSLPEPGFVQFFFLTPNGPHVVKGNLEQFQKTGSPFAQLLERFGFIQQFADQLLDENRAVKIKGLYILTFTPEKMDRDALMTVTHLAAERLKANSPTFKRRMEETASKIRIEIANIEYVATIHNPNSMQTLMDWLKKQYDVTFAPVLGGTFFPHGMRDPQGREAYLLFYFDTEG